jgi:tetratricopeptide (TPR) repeat protein
MHNVATTTASPSFDVMSTSFGQGASIGREELDRAEAYLNAGLVIEAGELFRSVVEAGGPARARWGLARCAYYRRELHEALGHLQVLDPAEFSDLNNDLGVIYFEMGLLEQSRRQMEQAAAGHPGNPLPIVNLIDIARAQGDRQGAIEYCRQYLALAPGDQEVEEIFAELSDQAGTAE